MHNSISISHQMLIKFWMRGWSGTVSFFSMFLLTEPGDGFCNFLYSHDYYLHILNVCLPFLLASNFMGFLISIFLLFQGFWNNYSCIYYVDQIEKVIVRLKMLSMLKSFVKLKQFLRRLLILLTLFFLWYEYVLYYEPTSNWNLKIKFPCIINLIFLITSLH